MLSKDVNGGRAYMRGQHIGERPCPADEVGSSGAVEKENSMWEAKGIGMLLLRKEGCRVGSSIGGARARSSSFIFSLRSTFLFLSFFFPYFHISFLKSFSKLKTKRR